MTWANEEEWIRAIQRLFYPAIDGEWIGWKNSSPKSSCSVGYWVDGGGRICRGPLTTEATLVRMN